MQSPRKQALAERSSNVQSPVQSPSKIPLPPSPSPTKIKTANAFDDAPILSHSALMHKIAEAQEQTYVSPSDNILSPATKKLSEVKGRRIANLKKSSLYNAHNLFGRATDAKK